MPELSTDHSSATLDGAHSHGGPRYVSSRADRPTSFDPADIPVPRGREEEWRFTPMKRFAPLFDLDAIRAAAADQSGTGVVRIEADLPDGVSLENVARSDARIGTVGARSTAPASLPGTALRPPPCSPWSPAPSWSEPPD